VCTLYATTHTARRWYNEATRDFIEWLKEFNGKTKSSDTPPVPIAMLGLDIYSLFTSADEVSFENWLCRTGSLGNWHYIALHVAKQAMHSITKTAARSDSSITAVVSVLLCVLSHLAG
jgi:Erythromycin esterase